MMCVFHFYICLHWYVKPVQKTVWSTVVVWNVPRFLSVQIETDKWNIKKYFLLFSPTGEYVLAPDMVITYYIQPWQS